MLYLFHEYTDETKEEIFKFYQTVMMQSILL